MAKNREAIDKTMIKIPLLLLGTMIFAGLFHPAAAMNDSSIGCVHKLSYVVGTSMRPTIEPGQDVYYRKVNWRTTPAKIGDVVLMSPKGTGISLRGYEGRNPEWIVHRVTDVSIKGYFLKGDNNTVSDGVLYPKRNLQGIVCMVGEQP